MSRRHSERFSVSDDEDDIYNPKSKAFCRACIDSSSFATLKGGKEWLEKRKKSNCPPDKPELGRATWTFLHTMAAYYPEQPSELQKRLMADFLRGFGTFYPCVPCAEDLRKNMILHPPQIQSRDALSGWMCMQHNLVNKKIHKPLFDCSTALERWRYGWKDGSCDPPGMD